MFENALKAADDLAVALRFRLAHPEGMCKGEVITIEQTLSKFDSARAKASPQRDRCKYGVWSADHCYECEKEASPQKGVEK